MFAGGGCGERLYLAFADALAAGTADRLGCLLEGSP